MKFIQIEQNTDQWHEFRRMKIGSSAASAIMGVNPWKTPLMLWNEMLEDHKSIPNAAMVRGAQLEPLARTWYANRLDREIYPAVIQSEEHPWQIASLDGWDEYLKVPVEIKCPSEQDHMAAINGRIPDHYYPQLQHQMMVSKSQFAIYISFDGQEGIIHEVKANKEYQDELFDKEQAFYESLLSYEPPKEISGDRMMITDDAKLKQLRRMQELSNEIKLREKEYDSIKKEFIETIPHDRISLGGIKVTRILRKGQVNYGSIPELIGVDLDKYRKEPIISYRFDFND